MLNVDAEIKSGQKIPPLVPLPSVWGLGGRDVLLKHTVIAGLQAGVGHIIHLVSKLVLEEVQGAADDRVWPVTDQLLPVHTGGECGQLQYHNLCQDGHQQAASM